MGKATGFSGLRGIWKSYRLREENDMEELTTELYNSSKCIRNAYLALRREIPQFAAVMRAEAHDDEGYALIEVKFYFRSGKPHRGLEVYRVNANDHILHFVQSIEEDEK